MSRVSPDEHAGDCKGMVLVGNDGNKWISAADKNGTYKWKKWHGTGGEEGYYCFVNMLRNMERGRGTPEEKILRWAKKTQIDLKSTNKWIKKTRKEFIAAMKGDPEEKKSLVDYVLLSGKLYLFPSLLEKDVASTLKKHKFLSNDKGDIIFGWLDKAASE